MNRKRLRKLEASFRRRGAEFYVDPEAPPEITRIFLEELLDCPDCRAAVLEACADKSANIDETLRDLAMRGDH